MSFQSIAFIGFGTMAAAITENLLKNGYAPQNIKAYGGHERTESLTKKYHIQQITDSDEITADLLIVAVKPQQFESAITKYKIKPSTIVVSLMAGVTLERMGQFIKAKLVRIMPNLGAALGMSSTAIYGQIGAEDLKKIELFCGLFGSCFVLQTEEQMHSFTALAGSGPAHFLKMMSVFMDFAKAQNFTQEQAEKMVLQTAAVATELLKKADEKNPENLIEKISSKGGTTEAALNLYKEQGFTQLVQQALIASVEKSKSL